MKSNVNVIPLKEYNYNNNRKSLMNLARYISLYMCDMVCNDTLCHLCADYGDGLYTIKDIAGYNYNRSLKRLSIINLNNTIDDSKKIFSNADIKIINQIRRDSEMTQNKYIDILKEKAFQYCIKSIKDTFGVTLKFNFNKKQYRDFLKWLKKYDPKFKQHIIKNKDTDFDYILNDVDFIIKVGERTYARIMTDTAIKNNLSDVDKFNNRYISDNSIHVYVFGKETYKVAKVLKNMCIKTEIVCYKVTAEKSRGSADEYYNSVYYEELNSRSKDSVFLNGNTKDEILNHINNFFYHKDVYDKRNLKYKTGILLYGEPGTGKTTIANMIATEFQSDIVLVNMSEFIKINIDALTSAINADDKNYVVLLEDIDCVIGDRESKDEDLENKKNVNKLLQFLDSTSSPSNVIFVATTNHIEKLDSAILRDGRFDLIVNITDINKDTAYQMCKSFNLSDKVTTHLLEKYIDTNKTINPAKLQNLILKQIDNK